MFPQCGVCSKGHLRGGGGVCISLGVWGRRLFTKHLFLDMFCTELYCFLFLKVTAIFHLKMFLKLCWRLLGTNPAVLRRLSSFKVTEIQRVDSVCYTEELLKGGPELCLLT